MKAICVTPDRVLELRDIPMPTEPPPGYLLVDIEACAINHGDKTFLKAPQVAGGKLDARVHDVWGASASGRVVAVGPGAPLAYAGSQVAIYRGLQRDLPVLGLWCERAQVPYRTCLPLPQRLSTKEYSGSLVNVMTAYAFLEQAVAEGHAGVIATAGNSVTGLALAALARRRRIPAIFLVRTPAAKAELQRRGIEHVIVNQEGFLGELADLAARLGATAVFDGVGGALVTSIAPTLAINSTIYIYGLLAGAAPISLPSVLFLMKNLTLKRFSNFESSTVRDPEKLATALLGLQSCIDDPLFKTRVGQEFRLDQFDAAMSYETVPGAKAVFVP
jgi:NADPH2:quinone reductase